MSSTTDDDNEDSTGTEPQLSLTGIQPGVVSAALAEAISPEDEGLVLVPVQDHIEEQDTDDEITAKLARQGVQLARGKIYPPVFWPALIAIIAVVIVAVSAPDWTNRNFSAMNTWIVENLGWYYVLIVAFFVVFAIGVGISKMGRIRLGREGDEPEFSLIAWFSMLFAAGMGIGLVFYGVGEPLGYATTQIKPGWSGTEEELAGLAMAQTFVHWGLHPWAIYAVIGLALAYAVHRRGRPVSIRWALEPILGDRVKGWAGNVIDILAIFGTVFGVATSLGLGVQQISAGMKEIGIVDEADNRTLVILIVVITWRCQIVEATLSLSRRSKASLGV